MAWQMAISEGGVITGLLTCAEICSASCSGGMRGWRYIEWQYNEGTLYFRDDFYSFFCKCFEKKDRSYAFKLFSFLLNYLVDRRLCIVNCIYLKWLFFSKIVLYSDQMHVEMAPTIGPVEMTTSGNPSPRHCFRLYRGVVQTSVYGTQHYIALQNCVCPVHRTLN
jgi:hypothetical protein